MWDNLRRKDSLRGAETAKISVRLGNYAASHFEGSTYGPPKKEPEMEVEKMVAPEATQVYHVPASFCLIRLGTRGRRRGVQDLRRIRASLGDGSQGQWSQRRTHYA